MDPLSQTRAFNQPENDGVGQSLFLERGESPNASSIIGVNLIQISFKKRFKK